MDKWQKLKGFLTDGKEHITKDFYVSRPSVFEEILDIMEELEKREVCELKGELEMSKVDVLNKIRAEIDTARFIDKGTKLCKNANASGLEVAMQIIDKYKAESEELKGENKMSDEEKLDLIGCGVNIGSRWSKQNTIAEIEKIKAEIKDLHNSHMIHLIDTDGVVDTCLDIIDEHISELKEGAE